MLHCPTCGQDFADEVRVCPEDGAPLQADPTVAIARPVVDSLLGRTLDEKYRLDERLGTGGMGTVYRATHLLIDRPVAIKVLNSRYVEDEAAQVRFRREARAAGRLQHSNAVTVTDFGTTSDGLVYIVMELLEGHTLRDVLGREAPLDVARAVSIMLQISSAVGAAHAAGIIHRDLKPANIFIVQRKDAPPFVKVLDFGIAKLAAEALDDDDDPQTLTQVGAMIGTPRYMSPEQCDGAPLTPAADVYSLGIILYEMLTGTTPFNGTSPLAIAIKHSSQMPRSPREFVATIPNVLEAVVLRALEKKPEDRPANAEAFRQELYAVAERLGLEHADSLSAPTIESLRSAGTETPSGRLVIDIERLRQSRAAASAAAAQPEVIAHNSNIVEEHRPSGNGNSFQPVMAAPDPDAVPVATPPRAPGVARMRIFFGRKKSWFRLLTRPIRILLISIMALLLLVIAIAVVATRTPGKLAVASEVGETLGSVALRGEGAGLSTDEEKEEEARRETRGTKETRRTTSRPAQQKKPSVIRRAWDKTKKIFKNPF
ncbi:MAG: eukaryotic-like serine/threonine-protein kinase [Acidobacteriota bacterium]|jgi:serine/threonine-protein kinase|nr:eukaryotic-like serine/threonine-protein kinase [Acidobacteriota bacterium]